MANQYLTLARNENQARGIANYAIDFLGGKFAGPDESVFQMVERFISTASPAAFRRSPGRSGRTPLEAVARELGGGS